MYQKTFNNVQNFSINRLYASKTTQNVAPNSAFKDDHILNKFSKGTPPTEL